MGFPDPGPVIAAAGQATSDIDLVISAYDAVRRGPAVLAQTLLTLDHATRGRVVLALGAGELKQLVGYGYSRKDALAKQSDNLRCLRALLDSGGEPTHVQGEHWRLDGGRLPIRPYGELPPPIWSTPGPSWDVLGANADGLLTSLRRHRGGIDGFRRDVETFRIATARAGRDPDRTQVAGVVLCMIAEDDATLKEMMNSRVARFYTLLLGADRGEHWRDKGYRHPLGDSWGYARSAAPGRATADELNAAVDQVPAQAVGDLAFFAGTRDRVCETLAQYVAAGLTYASIVDYSGRIDSSLAQNARDNVEYLVTELQRLPAWSPPGRTVPAPR
ncbi:LLM class flavin-dependent oxidoreductase [[Mycobacterium] vasticus]|uniref:LLM class flavin-dependent oxidoreductase n=1 Tax=[Mycobacterium] vasticus TaxID=2875777 RepID=A0ABU5Z3X1_9MYCO|nr:LLM class flavin-dependent oxidoreductase [Mycolicibacter sp. MYC017]MEB3072078.1 LLM class flavin-dependent oxidoreductase [Mycolicibacter sp. MYC017]